MRFIVLVADQIHKQRTWTRGNHRIYTLHTLRKLTGALAWWQPGVSTKLPSSTPKERASGLHLLTLKCVDTSFSYYLIGLRHTLSIFDGLPRGRGEEEWGMTIDLRLTLGQQVEPSELQSVIASIDEKPPKKIFGSGFKIAGEKYLTIHAEDRSVYGKKVYPR